MRIEDLLEETCWEIILRESSTVVEELCQQKDSDHENSKEENSQVNKSALGEVEICAEEDHPREELESKEEEVEEIGIELDPKEELEPKEEEVEEIGIELELATEEKLTITFSQAMPGHLKLGNDAITSFYLSHCSTEQEEEKMSSSSEDTSYVEEDILETFVNIEHNGQLIQNWEKQQQQAEMKKKKSCFVTISEDLQIVENMAESVATKSPDVLVVGADLAEAVKGGEPLAALDMFINTELEDVKEIKEGLSILSYTLTSPGLVRYVSLTD